MFQDKVLKIVCQLVLHLVYGISKIKDNQQWLILYISINAVIFAFLLLMIAYYSFLRGKFGSKKWSPTQEQCRMMDEPTYVNFNTGTIDFDAKRKERLSQYSMSTEHEFSYYDPIKNNFPSEVASMKLLRTA